MCSSDLINTGLNDKRTLSMHIVKSSSARGVVALGCLLAATVLPPAGSAAAGENCQELVRNKCATCHFVTYICPKIKQGKGRFTWKGIVKDMVKEGMVATDREQEQLVDCLAVPDAPVKAFCPAR